MFTVLCPCCESPVEVAEPTDSPDRPRVRAVAVCPLCDTAFDAEDVLDIEYDPAPLG
jgi:hypothetical protein